jgi:hypothetical protein
MSAAYLKNPFAVPAGFRTAASNGACVRWQEAVICRSAANEADWKASGLPVNPVTISANSEWKPSELPTRIGHVVNGRLVPVKPAEAGHLSFGPYIVLPPGRYHYAIDYASDSQPAQQVGRWDVSLGGSMAAMPPIAAGALPGTSGQAKRVEGEFTAGDWHAPLEIRTFFIGGGDLQLIGISLDKVEPAPK